MGDAASVERVSSDPVTNDRERETYLHGHHASVLRSHGWRTAANSAAYLVPHLRPGMDLLDVGCGPGTITVDLARLVAPGKVFGIDLASEVLEAPRRQADEQGVHNVTFASGDVYGLALPDDSVDVVHAHQVLQHLADPVAALIEMRRVTRPGGLVAVRDADYAVMTWWPSDPRLDRWLEIYRATARASGGEPDAGRRLLGWAQSAGLTDVTVSADAWCFATPEERAWWGGTWAERATASSFAHQAVAHGMTSPEELAGVAEAWRAWARAEDGFFVVVHGEILARA